MKKFYNLGTWCSTDSAVVHSLCVAAPIVCGGLSVMACISVLCVLSSFPIIT